MTEQCLLIIRCFPVDMTWLGRHADRVRQTITVQHTEVLCSECYQKAWIGPGQRAHMTADPTARVVCWHCIVRIPQYRKDMLDFSKLHIAAPNTADAPSRFPDEGDSVDCD